MLRFFNIRLKSIYSKLFPLDSFRRFVTDQLLQSLCTFIYYGGIVVTTIVLFFFTLYFLGVVVEYLLGTVIKHAPPSLGSVMTTGFVSAMALSTVIVLISVIKLMMHDFDYVYWLRDQQSQVLAQEAAIPDYSQTTFIDRVLPKASLRKYLISRAVYTILMLIGIALYVILSVKAFKLIFGTPQGCLQSSTNGRPLRHCPAEDLPDFLIFMSSMGIQLFIFVIGWLVRLFLIEHCYAAYAKHLRRAKSSTAKRDDSQLA